MFNRSYVAIAITAIFILGLDLALSVHDLSAASSHAFQIHRNYPGAMDGKSACPAAATKWCQSVGGLDE